VIKTLFSTVLGTVLGVAKVPAELVINAIKAHVAKLAAPISPSTKAGVAIGFVFIVVYLTTFYVETSIERTVLLASTVGSLVAGYILGAKS
jgi:hypothetical protein